MSGFVANGRLEQALRSIEWMQQEGVRADVVTVATVVLICAELRALKPGKDSCLCNKQLFLAQRVYNFFLDDDVFECGVLDYSIRWFEGMEQRNVILWTAMIDSYVENGHLDEALSVIKSMVLSKHRPDSVAIGRTLCICNELKNLKIGKEIHGQVQKRSFESVPFVCAEIVKMYGRCGVVEDAKLVFDAIRVKGSMSWTAIIQAYRDNGLYEDAIGLFHEMRDKGFTPNYHTFQAAFSICNEAGFVDDACRIFNLMTRSYNVMASNEHYSLIIRLLKRFGRVEAAQRFIQLSSSSSSGSCQGIRQIVEAP